LSFNITGPSSRLRVTLGALTLIAAMLIVAGSAAARSGGIGTDPGARNGDGNATPAKYHRLWDKVTRNSYIPEMMDDIRDEFGKLEGQMVQPAQAQTRKVSELFRAMKENVANALKSLSGKLMSQAIGGFGGWGTRSGLLGGIQNLFGFADGGAFTVGGAGGIDSQLVAFRASPGERVTVDQAGEGSGGITVVQNLHFHPGVPETVRAELRRATPGIRESMLAALQDRVLRGGGFARAVRGA